jgi:hypothetical protein
MANIFSNDITAVVAAVVPLVIMFNLTTNRAVLPLSHHRFNIEYIELE